MESVVDALELSFAEEIDEDTKLTEASALLMKAMQVTAMLKMVHISSHISISHILLYVLLVG